MSAPLARASRRRPRRRASTLGFALRGVALVLVFATGAAVGSALDDNPDPGETRTYVRTLQPGTLAPAPSTTTVTITATIP